MTTHEQIINYTIKPHGGTLINRVVEGEERDYLLEATQSYKVITLNPWSISDLELIGIGGFSPLTGFMGEVTTLKLLKIHILKMD